MIIELHTLVAEENELPLAIHISLIHALYVVFIEVQRHLYHMRGQSLKIVLYLGEIIPGDPLHRVTSLNVQVQLAIH